MICLANFFFEPVRRRERHDRLSRKEERVTKQKDSSKIYDKFITIILNLSVKFIPYRMDNQLIKQLLDIGPQSLVEPLKLATVFKKKTRLVAR